VLAREGNTLASVLRTAWDGARLQIATKNSPATATGAHIALIGHITLEEFRRKLNDNELSSGFINRILLVCVRRSKLLPEGGAPPQEILDNLAGQLGAALAFARDRGKMERDLEAGALWREEYTRLAQTQPGILGLATARGEAVVMRLALIYALLDRAHAIAAAHLKAALALWRYGEDSAAFIFGDRTGDPIADAIAVELMRRREGMTRTEINGLFRHNFSSARIGDALKMLKNYGLAASRREPTGRRPAERWFWVKQS
jgi:hypothetical protein